MPRTALAAIAILAVAAGPLTAADAPPLGKTVQVEFTGKDPPKPDESRLAFPGYRMKEFEYPIEPGDRLRIEVEALGGVEMSFLLFVHKESPDGFEAFLLPNADGYTTKADWTMPKAPPGKRVKVIVASSDVGKVNLRISKVGMAAGGGTAASSGVSADELKQMKADIEALKQELAEIKKLLKDLKR